MNWIKALQEQNVVLLLFSVMVISHVFKEQGILENFYYITKRKIGSKRLTISIMSLFCGIIPIPGRISVTAALLDSLQNKDKNNTKFGMISYLTTHHYYLWLPTEKSVIISMAILQLTYFQFLSYMAVPIILSLMVCFGYIFFFIKEDQISFSETKMEIDSYSSSKTIDMSLLLACFFLACFISVYLLFPMFALYLCSKYKTKIREVKINWSLLSFVSCVVIFSVFLQGYSTQVLQLITNSSKINPIYYIAPLSFCASFILGSSSRYSTIAATCASIFGLEYFVLFYLLDYSGYLLSPVHKCVMIGKMYFKTPLIDYYKVLVSWVLILVIYSITITIL